MKVSFGSRFRGVRYKEVLFLFPIICLLVSPNRNAVFITVALNIVQLNISELSSKLMV